MAHRMPGLARVATPLRPVPLRRPQAQDPEEQAREVRPADVLVVVPGVKRERAVTLQRAVSE
jgi:hypothetical protein